MNPGKPNERFVNRDPIPAKKAEFVQSIRRRFKKADAILKYLMDKANQYNAHSDKTSGYSGANILWDTERDEEMTPAQKMAFFLQATGRLESKQKLANEVDGFMYVALKTDPGGTSSG